MITIYLDNVIASGRLRGDLQPPTELMAVRALEQPPYCDVVDLVTSRESWREQERTQDAAVRGALLAGRSALPVVQDDHRLRGFNTVRDPYGGFITSPLLTDVVDDALFAALTAEGLKGADARHLMYASCNGCDWFVTLDPDFLGRRAALEAHCPGVRIAAPSELLAALARSLVDGVTHGCQHGP